MPRIRINEDTWKYTLTRTHTFPAWKEYISSYKELNRNGGILNMDDSESMPFYPETVLVVDDRNGLNKTPVLLVPPVDKADVGKPFIHNPGANDPCSPLSLRVDGLLNCEELMLIQDVMCRSLTPG